MTGPNGGGRKTEWSLLISIAALLFGIVQFAIDLQNDDSANAIHMENRIRTLECLAGLCGDRPRN